jgi:hypothetical protein
MLDVLPRMPAALLDVPAAGLIGVLGGPTLIHVEGEREPGIFVSVLLHGNETSGWEGVRRYLKDHLRPPRSMTLFIGNVRAAAAGVRLLPDQQDYNRIWRGAAGPEGEVAQMVLGAIDGRSFFAAVDLHNNTGHNPYYGVVTDLEPANLGLAYLFSDKAVYIREPDTTMTRAFSDRCPAVTLEVGPTGDPECVERVYGYLERCLALDEIEPVDARQIGLFEALARVHVLDDIEFGFVGEGERLSSDPGSDTTPLMLTGGVEAVNFHELPAGTRFGNAHVPLADVLRVLDTRHRDVTSEYLVQRGSEILLARPIVPAMYTTDPFVVRQDCLCYFMARHAD